jgi:hypothetical protein
MVTTQETGKEYKLLGGQERLDIVNLVDVLHSPTDALFIYP